MPRVRPLTAELRQEEQDRSSNDVLACVLRRNRADTGIRDKELVAKLGVGNTSLCRWKQNPGDMSLNMARAIARECKMTPSDWLAVGGYKSAP